MEWMNRDAYTEQTDAAIYTYLPLPSPRRLYPEVNLILNIVRAYT